MKATGNYVLIGGEQAGPFTVDQLKTMWQAGQLTSETPYWYDGLSSWIRLGATVEDAIAAEKFQSERAVLASRPELIKQPTGSRNLLVVSALIFGVVLAFCFMVAAGRSAAPTDKPLPAVHRDVVENSAWDGSVSQVRIYVKKNAKDPKSVEFIEWSKVVPQGTGFLVRAKYRAKNSFGGYVIEEQVFVLDSAGKVVSAVPNN